MNYEQPKDTAKKIRKELKKKYPDTKFRVNCSRGSAVYVYWENGPQSTEVNSEVLHKFSSSTFDGMIDMAENHGYEYEGEMYNGADYVIGQRTLSKDHLAELVSVYKHCMCESEWKDKPSYEIESAVYQMEARGDLILEGIK